MVTDKEKGTCSGCTACVNACPSQCIKMERDEQGFLYPRIEQDLCIRCNVCDEVCALTSGQCKRDPIQIGYAAWAKDSELQKSSSSGGIFTLLCNKVLDDNGAVFGVAMADDNRSARHIAVETKGEVVLLRGAKYIQSNIEDSFFRAIAFLRAGRTVLFSGTPCQIDGLRALVKNDDANLICIDMICHGVPSPMIWERYCDETEKKYKKTIAFVSFRHKKHSWEKVNAGTKSDGKKKVFRSKNVDPYMRLFLGDYILRPSCYDCRHKGINRKSDITIADFWGVDKVIPGFSNGAGTSLVIVHTEKGRKYIESIKELMNIQEINIDESIKYNGSAIKSAKKPERLDEFWKTQSDDTIETLASKYTPLNSKETVKSQFKHSFIYGVMNQHKKKNMESGVLIIFDS